MRKIGISANSCIKCGAWSTELLGHTDEGDESLRCAYCGHGFHAPPPPSLTHLYRVEKVKYPQINGSMGVVVNSREHENHMAKKLGMVPAESAKIGGRTPKSTRRKVFRVAKAIS